MDATDDETDLEMETRRNLLRFADGSWTLDEFKGWFHPATWDHDDEFTGRIKLWLAERADPGYGRSDENLKGLFRSIATTYTACSKTASLSVVEAEPAGAPCPEYAWQEGVERTRRVTDQLPPRAS